MPTYRVSVLIGPFICTAVFLLLKAFTLSTQIIPERGLLERLIFSESLIVGDLPVLMLVLMLMAADGLVARPKWRQMFRVIQGLLSICYIADTIAILTFDRGLSSDYLLKVIPEWQQIDNFLSYHHVLLSIFFFGVACLSVSLRRWLCLILGGIALVISLLPITASIQTSPLVLKYGVFSRWQQQSPKADPQFGGAYSDQQVRYYTEQHRQASEIRIPEGRPNIVLLLVESLTSADSFRTSGLGNRLQHFDRLSEDGTLFLNFFANYELSEGGEISIVSGSPPLPFPGSSRSLYKSFRSRSVVLEQLKQLGYHTEFLRSAPLHFFSNHRYLSAVGFDIFRGTDEVERFVSAPRYTFSSPADEVLYEETLERINKLRDSAKPFVLIVATISSHVPYWDPATGKESADEVWRYVDQQLGMFYDQLRQNGFFENGILIVTGDHRRLEPVTATELKKYGPSVVARVPLAIVGKPIESGQIDRRYFQQSDLFYRLADITNPIAPLSPYPIWVEPYNIKPGRTAAFGEIRVFHAGPGGRQGARAALAGSTLTWLSEIPPFHRELEHHIHSIRAYYQGALEKSEVHCQELLVRSAPIDGATNGAMLHLLTLDRDGNVEQVLEQRVLEKINAQAVWNNNLVVDPGQVLYITSFLRIKRPGYYFFALGAKDRACLIVNHHGVLETSDLTLGKEFDALGERVIIDQYHIGEGWIFLTPGDHSLVIRYSSVSSSRAALNLAWQNPDHGKIERVPEDRLFLGPG